MQPEIPPIKKEKNKFFSGLAVMDRIGTTSLLTSTGAMLTNFLVQ
jgi:hypothetical protein